MPPPLKPSLSLLQPLAFALAPTTDQIRPVRLPRVSIPHEMGLDPALATLRSDALG
jgi:hypothetical protein